MITQLGQGDPVPDWEPRRYRTAHGYIKLRWHLGDGQALEVYEHRLVTGVKPDPVHHINLRKDDNRPDNLEVLSPSEHGMRHRTWDRARGARLYASGKGTIEVARMLGITAGAVSRGLRAFGVTMRPPRRSKTTVDIPRIASFHQIGMRAPTIADLVGTSAEIVRRVIRDLNLPHHPCGAPTLTQRRVAKSYR